MNRPPAVLFTTLLPIEPTSTAESAVPARSACRTGVKGVRTNGGSAIGSACYGFEWVNNLGYADRGHNLYRRDCPQKRLHSLQIRQDALLLVSTLTEGVGRPCRDGEHDLARHAQQHDGVEAVVKRAFIRGAPCDEEPSGDVLGEQRVHRLLAP
jgi:hypothetical protein